MLQNGTKKKDALILTSKFIFPQVLAQKKQFYMLILQGIILPLFLKKSYQMASW